jgi:hypothetical protein
LIQLLTQPSWKNSSCTVSLLATKKIYFIEYKLIITVR